MTTKEDLLIGRLPAEAKALKEFGKAYIEEIGHPLMLPFIGGNPDDALPMPGSYAQKLLTIEDRLRDVLKVIGTEEMPAQGSTVPISELEEWEARDDPPSVS